MSHTSAKLAATFSAHDAPQSAAARPGQTLLDRIGNTPLLRFDRFTAHLPGVTLLGKAEWYNPGGSVKDRAAANIVAEGRRSGGFTPGTRLRARRDAARVEATLRAVEDTARTDRNLLPPIIDAVKAYATVGEISDALRRVFGEYRESVVI